MGLGEPVAIDVVVPTLNAARTLPSLFAGLAEAGAEEAVRVGVIVADGGSTDDTGAIAHAAGARVVAAPCGRGSQLAAGAVATSAPWLLFLHADTVPAPGWRIAVNRFADDPANAGRAGYFRLRFASPAPAARRVERMVAWRSRVLGLPYGDQGLLIARTFYEALGGFRPMPLMEDVDLVRRIGRHRLAALPVDAVTSAIRYERDGWLLRPARNLLCLSLYLAGVPPRLIRRVYG